MQSNGNISNAELLINSLILCRHESRWHSNKNLHKISLETCKVLAALKEMFAFSKLSMKIQHLSNSFVTDLLTYISEACVNLEERMRDCSPYRVLPEIVNSFLSLIRFLIESVFSVFSMIVWPTKYLLLTVFFISRMLFNLTLAMLYGIMSASSRVVECMVFEDKNQISKDVHLARNDSSYIFENSEDDGESDGRMPHDRESHSFLTLLWTYFLIGCMFINPIITLLSYKFSQCQIELTDSRISSLVASIVISTTPIVLLYLSRNNVRKSVLDDEKLECLRKLIHYRWLVSSLSNADLVHEGTHASTSLVEVTDKRMFMSRKISNTMLKEGRECHISIDTSNSTSIVENMLIFLTFFYLAFYHLSFLSGQVCKGSKNSLVETGSHVASYTIDMLLYLRSATSLFRYGVLYCIPLSLLKDLTDISSINDEFYLVCTFCSSFIQPSELMVEDPRVLRFCHCQTLHRWNTMISSNINTISVGILTKWHSITLYLLFSAFAASYGVVVQLANLQKESEESTEELDNSKAWNLSNSVFELYALLSIWFICHLYLKRVNKAVTRANGALCSMFSKQLFYSPSPDFTIHSHVIEQLPESLRINHIWIMERSENSILTAILLLSTVMIPLIETVHSG